MRYCPRCGTEYLDHAETCADCNVPLVAEEELEVGPSSGPDEPAELLCEVADGVEADLLVALLADEGIPARSSSNAETVHIGFAEDHSGWGGIWVPRSHLPEARSLLRAFREASPDDSFEEG